MDGDGDQGVFSALPTHPPTRLKVRMQLKTEAGIVSLHHLDTDILIETASDLIKFDRIIKDIETAHSNMPILLKKYLKQNAKITGFNIDPKFNNALDGLMVLDLETTWEGARCDMIGDLRGQVSDRLEDLPARGWLDKEVDVHPADDAVVVYGQWEAREELAGPVTEEKEKPKQYRLHHEVVVQP